MTDRRPIVSKPPVKSTSDKDKRKLELIQLETRYKSSYRIVSDDKTETIVRLAIKPSDPDFPYEIEALQLQLKIPQEYPKKPCTCQILNTDIPKGFAINLEKGYSARVDPSNSSAHLTLVRQMNWLDRNMETLLQQAPAATVRFVSHNTDRDSNSDRNATAAAVMPQQRQFLDATSKPIDTNYITPASSSSKSITAAASSSKPIETKNNTPEASSLKPKPEASSSKPITKPVDVEAKSIATATSDPIVTKPKHTKSEINVASKKRKFQFKQLETRFCDNFKIVRSSAKETVVSLVLNINDPEFTHEQMMGGKDLFIKYYIPALYPLEPCTIDVDNKQLDKTRASWITDGFNEHVMHGNFTLFENLNWLNRNIELLISTVPVQKTEEQVEADTLAAQQLKDSKKLSINAAEFSPAKKKTSLFDEQDDIKKNKVIIVNDPSLINEQADEEEIEVEVATEEQSGLSSDPDVPADQTVVGLAQATIRKGTEIRLLSPKLENISLFRCTALHIMVKCARCKDTVEVENIKPEPQQAEEKKSNTERWMACPTCTSILGIKFLGELIHQGATTIGLLQLAGCTAYDMLPSTFIGTCGSCMSDMHSTIKLSPHDPPRTLNCFSCHQKMTVGLGDYLFVKIGSEGGERLRATEQQVLKLKKKKKREDPLTIGEPLPDQGTCSHYRKSKRWFRFSCCNKLYPCDICHDSHEDHVSELAKRQICGMCSREQTIQSGKPCVCGHEFDRAPQKGAFWEGGKGVRNKSTMSRKDPHKHKGLGKTTSKKQERVGTAGKERHQKDE